MIRFAVTQFMDGKWAAVRQDWPADLMEEPDAPAAYIFDTEAEAQAFANGTEPLPEPPAPRTAA